MPLVQALELVLNFQGAKIRPTLGAYSGTLDLIDIPGTRLSPRLCYPGEQSADEKEPKMEKLYTVSKNKTGS